MEIYSHFLREQRKYSESEIRKYFNIQSDSEFNGFIRLLKLYGIIKIVKNTNDERDISELVDENLLIDSDKEDLENLAYVFTYVGIVTIGNRILKIYPKYLLSLNDDTEIAESMRLILKVLENDDYSEEQIVNMLSGDGDKNNYNYLAVILYLLNDYFEYGTYDNTEEITEINGEGAIIWNRTIDNGLAIVEDNRPYYVELITEKSLVDDYDYFKRLHECILTECSKLLKDSHMEALFELEPVYLSEESIEEFGDIDYILYRLNAELSIQFNTRRQILLKTMSLYLSHDRNVFEHNNGISMYGTNAFNMVWERACQKVFCNQLQRTLGELKKAKGTYSDKSKTRLIDIIEKPEWRNEATIKNASETLKPDLITIAKQREQEWFIILDAKYYTLQLEKEKELSGNPGVNDITKQYLYQLAYKMFLKENNIAVVKNCFLMPTEGDEIVDKGVARLPMMESMGLENIQIRFIPAERLFKNYLNGTQISIEELQL